MSYKGKFLLSVNTQILNEQEKEIIKKYKPSILLQFGVVNYANIFSIISKKDNKIEETDLEESKKRLIQIAEDVKSLSKESLVFIDSEGGIVQRIKPPLTKTSYPGSGDFKVLYSNLLEFYETLDENIFFKKDETKYVYEDMAKAYKSFCLPQDMACKQDLLTFIKEANKDEKDYKTRALKSICDLIKKSFLEMALDLKQYGIDVILAPVADFFDGNGGAIQSRSFGNDPELNSEFCIAALSGIKEAGMKNCLKHFVGQGSARNILGQVEDAHSTRLFCDESIDRLMQREGLVFKKIFEKARKINLEIDFIMMSNLTLSNIQESAILKPLILSTHIMEELFKIIDLPKNIGIITDDVFDMPLVHNHLSKNKSEKISVSKTVFETLKSLKRDYFVINNCSLEYFDSSGGFDPVADSDVELTEQILLNSYKEIEEEINNKLN